MEAFSKSCCLADTETYVGQLHRCKFYNIYCKKCSIIDDVGWGQGRGEGITNCHPSFSTIINIPSVFVWHRYQKKQQIKSSVQIQNNLAPATIEIDSNSDQNEQKLIQKRLKWLEMAIKGSVLEVYTQTKPTCIWLFVLLVRSMTCMFYKYEII